MKFIHTSDWHIGLQFRNVSLLSDQQYVLDQLVACAEAESVDAVVIAGDLYDRSTPPAEAVALLDAVLERITTELGIPVILIPGNHDSADRLGFCAAQMKHGGLHILGRLDAIQDPVIVPSADGDVAFYGIPYNDPATVRDQFDLDLRSYDEAHRFLIDRIKAVRRTDCCNVLISHCFMAGGLTSDSERMLAVGAVGGADQVSAEPCADFDYVALGHLHSPQYRGAEYIRYSGSLMKYSFSEVDQDKGLTLVEMSAGGFQSQRHIPLIPKRDVRIVEDSLENVLRQGEVDPHKDDYLLVRLTDSHAILDAMSRVRTVYPNTLSLEKPGMLGRAESQNLDRELLKRGELEMFRDFFSEVSGRQLSAAQDQALANIIDRVRCSEGLQ